MKKVGEARFEGGTNFFEMDDFDVFITEVRDGTLVTTGAGFEMEEPPLLALSVERKTLRFFMAESAGVFSFAYFWQGQSLRSVLRIGQEHIAEEGEPLATEFLENDPAAIIFALIGKVTGTHFYSIEADHPSQYYPLLKG